MRRLGVLTAVWLASLAALCTPPRLPGPPQTLPQDFLVTDKSDAPHGGVTVSLAVVDAPPRSGVSGPTGFATVFVPAVWRDVDLGLSADGCTTSHQHVLLDGQPHQDAQAWRVSIDCAPSPPVLPTTGETQAIHPDGRIFRRADGTPFPWIGASDFALFHRFLSGEDVGPILDDRIAHGFNVLRVFAMYGPGIGNAAGLGPLRPGDWPTFYAQARALTDLAATRGLLLEWTAVADADCPGECLMPDFADVQTHVTRLADALQGAWNIAGLEIANEPFKNFVRAAEITLDVPFPWATGIYDVPEGAVTIPHGTYLTNHSPRDDEWVRKSHESMDLYDGFGVFQGVHVPVVQDEPMGFGEPAEPNRSTSIEDARAYAATAAMFGAGSTYHSNDGVASRLLRASESTTAGAWAEAARWVPVDAANAPYQRGCSGGGPCVGDMPLNHRDLEEGGSSALRTFCKNANGFEWCVAQRPSAAWTPMPLRSCTIVEQPWRGFVKLTCP